MNHQHGLRHLFGRFRLTATTDGTSLVVTESGFDSIPPGRRDEAFRMNSNGWAAQIKNLEAHVSDGA